jgi:hypothetical protein
MLCVSRKVTYVTIRNGKIAFPPLSHHCISTADHEPAAAEKSLSVRSGRGLRTTIATRLSALVLQRPGATVRSESETKTTTETNDDGGDSCLQIKSGFSERLAI